MHVHTMRRLWSQSLHLLASVSMTLLLLAGCGGEGDGGGGGAPPVAAPLVGVFIDSPVQGLGYSSAPSGLTGVTNASGEYNYQAGDTVTFTLYGRSIGDAVPAGPVVTALMVFNATSLSDPKVINLAQLLLTLGGIPAGQNPIQLPATAPAGLTLPDPLNFSSATFDADLQTALTPAGLTLVSEPAATTHLSTSFKTLAVTFVNSGTVTSNPAGINCTTGTCSAVFQTGTVVTLTATGTGFTGWSAGTGSAACTGTDACAVTLTADSTITAPFLVAQPPPPQFTLAGIWRNVYQCTPNVGPVFTGDELITVGQTGNNVTIASGAFTATGTWNEATNVMTYSGETTNTSGPGFRESGTWTRTPGNDNALAKSSTWENMFDNRRVAGGGTCTGTLTRQP